MEQVVLGKEPREVKYNYVSSNAQSLLFTTPDNSGISIQGRFQKTAAQDQAATHHLTHLQAAAVLAPHTSTPSLACVADQPQ